MRGNLFVPKCVLSTKASGAAVSLRSWSAAVSSVPTSRGGLSRPRETKGAVSRGELHEAQTAHRLLGVYDRHRRTRLQKSGRTPQDAKSALEKTAAGPGASGTAGNKGKITGGFHGHSVLGKPVTRPGTTPLSS